MSIQFDKEFYDNVDEHIRLANRLAQNLGDEKAAAVLNFAASRYCAYLAATNSRDKDEFCALRGESLDYFCSIYKMNLERNLDHFEKNYDAFIEKHRHT